MGQVAVLLGKKGEKGRKVESDSFACTPVTKRIELPCFVKTQECHPAQIGWKASDKVVNVFKDFFSDRFRRVDQSRIDWQKVFGDLCRCQDFGQLVEI